MLLPSEYRPHPALRPYVKCHWTITSVQNDIEDKNAPFLSKQFLSDSGLKICFNLAAPTEFVFFDGRVELGSKGYVCGALTKNYWLHLDESLHSYGIQFHPGGAYPFIPFNIEILTNEILDLDEVWGSKGRQLTAAIHRPDLTTRQRIEVLETFLLKRLEVFKTHDAEFEYAAQTVRTQQGRISLNWLSKRLGLSLRQMERKFHQKCGLTPKRLCRILRFRQLFEHISARPSDNWVHTALSCGYYDQAHLIHDFKRFTGRSPAAFIKEIVDQDRFINWGYDMDALTRFGVSVPSH